MPDERRILDVGELRTEGRKLYGLAAPYNSPSKDLGGFVETIAAGAFTDVLRAEPDVHLVLNHDFSQVLWRTKSGTLRLRETERGLEFDADLPDSPLGENVRESVSRGDIDGASFRFQVGAERWAGDRRTVVTVSSLADITVATRGAYAAAHVELRTHNPAEGQEEVMDEPVQPAVPAPSNTAPVEDRAAPSGGLSVEDRVTVTPPRGLADGFRAAGFPASTATMAWNEYEDRAVTWTGSVDNVNKIRTQAGALGYDQRYVWPVVPTVGVDSATTSVDVFTQSARALATAANVVRAISAVTAKPETGSTLTIVSTAMNQVATVQSGIPNIYLETQGFATTIENDLRLALSDGLDKLVLDKFVASGFQTPLANMLLSARAAITTLRASGYAPDVIVLTPAADEALDVLVSGIASGTADFVFQPGAFAPGTIFGLQRRVSKTVPAPVVFDSQAFGKLYASPVSLARFEEAAGSTNTSLVRLETSGVFGVERQAAAIRIAAS